MRLFAVQRGEGRPVILLHGGLGTHLACTPFAEPLAERFCVITPDLRGSGRSHDAGPLSWDQLADDVAALARSLGHERVAIGGVSMGAGVAVRVALRHPALVAALIVIHPAYTGTDVGLTPAQQAAMRAMDEAGRRAPTEGVSVLLPLFDALPARSARALAGSSPTTIRPASRRRRGSCSTAASRSSAAPSSRPSRRRRS
jgi:pimeloyl-ACP methyl ester carboxylesterase